MFTGGKKGDQMRKKRVSTTLENPAVECAIHSASLYRIVVSQTWRWDFAGRRLSLNGTSQSPLEPTQANVINGDSIEDVNKHCLAEFRKHWTCLDDNNQQLWQCRAPEWKLNKCVFENLVKATLKPCV